MCGCGVLMCLSGELCSDFNVLSSSFVQSISSLWFLMEILLLHLLIRGCMVLISAYIMWDGGLGGDMFCM